MRVDGGLRDREAQAEAAGAAVARARLVGAVEPLEDVRQVLRGDRGSLVVHRQTAALAPLLEGHLDGGAHGGVLHGIVDKDADHAAQPVRVALHVHALGDGILHGRPALERDGVELEGGGAHDFREVDVGALQDVRGAGDALVGARELQKVVYERLHVAGLLGRAVHPAPGVCGEGLVALEDLRVREDDGERRLQLVRRVGHEAALLVPGALDGRERPVRELPRDAEQDEDSHGNDLDVADEGIVERVVHGGRVDDRDAGRAGARRGRLPRHVVLGKAPMVCGRLEYLLHHLLEHGAVYAHVVVARLEDDAALRYLDGEGEHVGVALAGRALSRGADDGDGLRGPLEVAVEGARDEVLLVDVGGVERHRKDAREDEPRERRDDGYELSLELLEHGAPTLLLAVERLEAVAEHAQRRDLHLGMHVRELLAQERDVRLDGVLGRVGVGAPHAGEEVLLGHDARV